MPNIGGALGVVGSAGTNAGLLTIPGQSYLPGTHNGRRSLECFGTGSSYNGVTTGFQDVATRASFSLPVTPTRCRLRIRNSSSWLNGALATPLALTGAWWGTANVATATTWNGTFTAAPTLVATAVTQSFQAEYVTPWFTPPSSFQPNTLQALSLGATCATDSQMTWEQTPGYTWRGTTGAGCAAAAGGAAAPIGTGVAYPYTVALDYRLEYEYAGTSPIGVFLGTSITNGFLQTITTPVAYGNMGSDSTWPKIASKKLGHCPMNGGVGAATTGTFTNITQIATTRLLSPESNYTAFANTPDYAVLDLGLNDSATPLTLAQFQTNMLTIISNLKSLGITKVFICTIPPGYNTEYFGSLTTFQVGTLSTPITAGVAITTIGINAGSTVNGGNVGGGYPGLAGQWFDAAISTGTKGQLWVGAPANGVAGTSTGSGAGEGPITISTATGFAGAAGVITFPAFTFQNTHTVGDLVMATREGYRQNYNWWIRSGIPSAMCTIDIGRTLETPAGGQFSGLFVRHPYFYQDLDDIHPNTPAAYAAMADTFVINVLGI